MPSDNSNHEELQEIFLKAVELAAPEERAAFLAEACGEDSGPREAIESLLKEYEEGDGGTTIGGGGTGGAAAETLSEKPGTMIGRYKLLQKIGEGGFGIVWMAEQTEPVVRRVALKVIKLGMDTKEVIARFEAERQALAMMEHPNIAKVLDAGATNTGRPYFAMELVKGVPITHYCDKNKLSARQRLELFVPVCQAIQHAHQKGVIHRDIKPSNVMVTLHDGVPITKVIDFGIAKAINQRLTEKTLFTNYAQMIGTPAYMSPEQAEMSGLDVDTRSDIYSLGVLLYELLTATTPFQEKELLSLGYGEMQRIITEKEPPRPSTRVGTMQDEELTVVAKNRNLEASAIRQLFRGELDWIVMKTLEKDRTRRYETANALRMDIERHLNDETVSAVAPSRLYRAGKFIRKHRGAMASLAAIVVVLIAATAVSVINARRAQKSEEVSVNKQQQLQQTLDQLHSVLVDKVQLEMAGGNEAKVQLAIDQAELAGLPANQIQLFRGQAALFNGRPREAVEILERLSDSSVAALALLADAQIRGGGGDEWDRTVERLKQKIDQADSLNYFDKLFAAQALIDFPTSRVVELVREALADRDSPLARMTAAQVIAAAAHQEWDSELAKRALRHLEVALVFFDAEAPSLVEPELLVKHVAWSFGLPVEVEFTTDQLAEYESKLVDNPLGMAGLIRLLADLEDERAFPLVMGRIRHATDVEMLYYPAILLRYQSPAEVLAAMESNDSGEPFTLAMRARVMALIPDQHDAARQLCNEMLAAPTTTHVKVEFLSALLIMGDLEEAKTWGQRLVDKPESPLFYSQEIMQFLAGEVDERTLLANARGRADKAEAHSILASQHIANGNGEVALAHLRRCVDLSMWHMQAYQFAKTLVEAAKSNHPWAKQLGLTDNVGALHRTENIAR